MNVWLETSLDKGKHEHVNGHCLDYQKITKKVLLNNQRKQKRVNGRPIDKESPVAHFSH